MNSEIEPGAPWPNNGKVYATVKSLSEMFTMSKQAVINKIEELEQAYEIRKVEWGSKVTLIHLGDFLHALFDSQPSARR